MKISDLVEKLALTVYAGNDLLNKEVKGGYVSDLLSDVMGNVEDDAVWITIQNHKNVVAVATLRDVGAVLLAKGIKPEQEMLEFAIEEQLVILGSELDVFTLTGKLYGLIGE